MSSTREPKKILITGATGAIGGALAQAYASSQNTLYLQGRNMPRLEELAVICRGLGAKVITKVLDVKDSDALVQWLHELCQQDTIDLVIANAGVNSNIGPECQGEQWENIRGLIEVNLLSLMLVAETMIPFMRARGNGQIALISSLAGYFGLPITPSYCASKAGVKAYGEALRGWLKPYDVRVNVVMPGYVDSAMCRAMPGPKPFLWQPEKAARYIKLGLAQNRPRISFPFPLNLGTWFLAALPAGISERIVRALNYAK
ncbi:MAG: oxidoreductase, short-chain dehydrogenase/reductase family [Solimicrobium sp.]|jgi:short-subunit dehydrogenase|nr:oxidoreductase, short-chain dehydrogenase/reductase family [Solimicrobium sp.]